MMELNLTRVDYLQVRWSFSVEKLVKVIFSEFGCQNPEKNIF